MASLTKKSELRQELADMGLPQTRPRAKWNPGLHEVIRMKNKESTEQIKEEHSSTRRVSRILRKLTQVSFCQICYQPTKLNSEKFIADCGHKGFFCESCLHHYAVYTIEQFGKVRCPNSGCEQQLQVDSDFFKSLPSALQVKYRQILHFYETLADPSLRLCPSETCEGTLKANHDSMCCDLCKAEFCGRCLLPIHSGDCDAFELQFFEETLRYRQCPRCRSFIDKFQGCNHMTCICKHEFCYVCGANWDIIHYSPHDEKGPMVLSPQFSVAYATGPRALTRKQQIFYYSTLLFRLLLSVGASVLILALLPLMLLLTIFVPIILPCTRYSRYTSRIVREGWNMYFQCYKKAFMFFFRKNRFN